MTYSLACPTSMLSCALALEFKIEFYPEGLLRGVNHASATLAGMPLASPCTSCSQVAIPLRVRGAAAALILTGPVLSCLA